MRLFVTPNTEKRICFVYTSKFRVGRADQQKFSSRSDAALISVWYPKYRLFSKLRDKLLLSVQEFVNIKEREHQILSF